MKKFFTLLTVFSYATHMNGQCLEFTPVHNSSGMIASNYDGIEKNEIVQVITPLENINSVSVTLQLATNRNNGIVDPILDIIGVNGDGTPDTSTVHATVSVSNSVVNHSNTGGGYGDVIFDLNFNLQANVSYGLRLRTSQGSGGIYWRRSSTPDDPSNPYSGGDLFEIYYDMGSQEVMGYSNLDLQFKVCGKYSVLDIISENGNTGIRLTSSDASLYGDIGNNALDLSYSNNDTSLGATGDSSVTLGENTTASGTFATAIGVGTKANGQGSTAMGSGTIADGSYATAGGFETNAGGDYALAIGLNAVSSGAASTALGNGTTASGDNAFSSGIGTTASGNFSTAMGINTTASGQGSTAFGSATTASGLDATAMGWNSTASGGGAVAIGAGSEEEYDPSLSTPYYKNQAMGDRSFVLGSRNKSTATKSYAIGGDNLAQGVASGAIGENNISSGDYSMAMGLFSESVANNSFAFGNNAYADGFNTVAVGSANTLDPNAVTDQWNANNRAFVVGNGLYDQQSDTVNRSDAFTIWFNGDATLAGNLSVNSDARLKANIITLGSTLAKLLLIDGKKYTMKRDESQQQNIGVLAQDIEKVFPELVSESNGVKSVNYQGLIPVLINALKEQDNNMKMQEERLNKQALEIEKLKNILLKK